jgi:hypothetical protein
MTKFHNIPCITVDARTTPTHAQPSQSCPARQRLTRVRLEIRTHQNQLTQTLIPRFFTQDSGSS